MYNFILNVINLILEKKTAKNYFLGFKYSFVILLSGEKNVNHFVLQ